ncbi:endonuclease/exonuclease/phosphatase family protein [uncultured Cellulomonas sp.]|uniref:endonuclease/exonuclease/phosphatase family protein n=1 Tax=uncultured Cellulomonas sp. TaxID=189682 RepID=UPI0028E744A1|nr:endonuclease/exonuclease/phosphatase family protein [uncultured Cellulomonas sp.]
MTTTPPAGTPVRTPPDAGTPTRVWLVALLTVMCLELVRASGPLLDRAFAAGVVQAAVTALGTYACAGLVAALLLVALRRPSGSPDARTLLVGAAVLAVLRLTVQALDGGALVVVGLLAVAVAVGVLTLAVSFVAGRPAGGRQAAIGLVLGCGLSAGLQLVLGTWDAVWRDGGVGWLVAAVLAVGVVVTARGLVAFTASSASEATGRPRRLWVLGLFLALAAMIVANPAFVASQSGVALGWAGLVVVVANALGAWTLLRPDPWSAGVRVGAAVLLVAGAACALWLTGIAALVAVVVLQLALGIVLSAALSAHRPAPRGITRTGAATLVVGLGTIGPLLLYMLDYDVPLPVDNVWVIVLAATGLALSGLRRRTPGAVPALTSPDRLPRRASSVRLMVLPALVLGVVGLLPSTTSTTGAEVPARADESPLTLVDWNLHYGVSPLTAVDLEGIAATIEEEDPDVVTLQEVNRGWVFGGGTDMATWLAHRLGMTVRFAPAADHQFGNAVLARSELTDVVVHRLPYGAGPQSRSALCTTLTTADGTELRVTSIHTQHREANTPTRLEQLEALADAEPVTSPALLAGDLNAEPGWPEIELLESEGWEPADSEMLTSPADRPTAKIDWVFGQGVTFVRGFVWTTPLSDHRPLSAELTVD